jgi:ADP-heptose:LPS heptosyltransferase
MHTVLEQLPPGARVAIVRLRSLGDCVLTTAAIRILKLYRSDLAIGVVVEPRFEAVFTGNPDIEVILEPDFDAVRLFAPDICLNFHGGARSLQLTLYSGARFRAGFSHFRFSFLYNVRIPRAQQILGEERVVHTVEHLASAMFSLGVPKTEIPRACLYPIEPAPPMNRPYCIIHPLASQMDKTWPAERFLAVADTIQPDLKPVFIGAAGDNLSSFSNFTCLQGHSLEQVKSLIAGATLFVGNDSGPAHMAAAFGIPVVVIFGSSDSDIWYPWRTPSRVLRSHTGIEWIGVERVVQSLQELRVHV